MDANNFVKTLESVLDRHLDDCKLMIKSDNLPTGVSFIVTSAFFEDKSRWDRIEFLRDIVREAFGHPPPFIASGVALTPTEAKNYLHDDSDEQVSEVSDSPGSAARPLDHG